MKTKTKKRLLISSIAMLLVAVLALGTATFAWFAMNNTVSASGMSVQAKSNSLLFEIKKDGDEDSNYGSSATVTYSNPVQLFPVSHVLWDEAISSSIVESFDTQDPSNGTNYNNWYYRFSNTPKNAGPITPVSSETIEDEQDLHFISNFDGYVATQSFQVRLRSNGDGVAKKVYVSSINLGDNDNKGVNVIVRGGDSADEVQEYSTNNTNIDSSNGTIFDSLNEGDVKTVKVYIYFDGNSSNIYTNNIDNLAGNISFTLSLTDAE